MGPLQEQLHGLGLPTRSSPFTRESHFYAAWMSRYGKSGWANAVGSWPSYAVARFPELRRPSAVTQWQGENYRDIATLQVGAVIVGVQPLFEAIKWPASPTWRSWPSSR